MGDPSSRRSTQTELARAQDPPSAGEGTNFCCDTTHFDPKNGLRLRFCAILAHRKSQAGQGIWLVQLEVDAGAGEGLKDEWSDVVAVQAAESAAEGGDGDRLDAVFVDCSPKIDYSLLVNVSWEGFCQWSLWGS